MFEQTALIVFASLTAASQAGAPTQVVMGDGRVDGRRIAPYAFEWRQCALQDGEWKDLGLLAESAVAIGDLALRVRQEIARPDGARITASTYFDRASLAPLRMEQETTAPDGVVAARAEHVIGPDGYEGRVTQNGETQIKSGAISRKMFHGGALGLPLATINYENAPFAMAALMMGFDATYAIAVHLAGEETWRHEGRAVDILLVDVAWVHNETGDAYPPGPDASGGRYWIAQNPPEGFPYAPRYKTDSYAVEFIPDLCKIED